MSARFTPVYVESEAVEERSGEDRSGTSSAEVTDIGGVALPIGIVNGMDAMEEKDRNVEGAQRGEAWEVMPNATMKKNAKLVVLLVYPGLPQALEGFRAMDDEENDHEAMINDDITSSLQAYTMQGMLDKYSMLIFQLVFATYCYESINCANVSLTVQHKQFVS